MIKKIAHLRSLQCFFLSSRSCSVSSALRKGFTKGGRITRHEVWLKAFNKLQKAASHCAVLCLLNFFFLIWNHQETLKRNNYISWPPCLTFFIKFLDLRADLGRRFLCIGSAFIMLFQPQRRGGGGGGGGTSLKEANGDVPLNGVAFAPLDWP